MGGQLSGQQLEDGWHGKTLSAMSGITQWRAAYVQGARDYMPEATEAQEPDCLLQPRSLFQQQQTAPHRCFAD